MTTVQAVFDIAIHLMDAQHEATGSTNTVDTKSYAHRTPPLLNSVLDQVYPYSDTYLAEGSKGQRLCCPKVQSLEDPLDLDEAICTNVLPYALAGLLLTEEDPDRADFFWQTYRENLFTLASMGPAQEESVVDVYGIGNPHGQFSHW